MLTKKFNLLMIQLIVLFILCLHNEIKCQDLINCPEGFKAKDLAFCPTIMTCPTGLIKVNLFTCAYEQRFAPPSECKIGHECWNGDCVDSSNDIYSLCPSHISCPSSSSITKCSDNSCVDNENDCPNYVECPPFNPIRCGNGDCRKSLKDCPSLIRCPSEYPILCNDGSCHLIKDQCLLASKETKCVDSSMTRCSDGTCATSKLLCPTLVTCPSGYEKCYDGNCKPKGTCLLDDDSSKQICDSNNEVLCQFDFSCAKSLSFCPTGIICPVDKPVKCWDNSCRDIIENCPTFQKCPTGLKECPDGSCGIGECGTHITCSSDAPYRCFDNTCRQNPEDCPEQPSCPSETPILCWDGRCLAERGECLAPDKCDSLNPIKCPNGLCSKNLKDCKQVFDCPSEFVRCKDGTCRKKLAYCPAEECPVNLPIKCKNGLCVTKEEYCDSDNGCPYYAKIKCKDGSCVENEEKCPPAPVCESGKKLCPDGSCLATKTVCPSVNGCPVDTPFKCANGECINLKKNSCSIPICDPTIPIKCFDGTCVLTTSYCPVERKIASNGNVICADGVEKVSYDECKPLIKCEEGEVRCGDGSCRLSKNYCPKANTCPDNQVRCENGSCAPSESLCPFVNGCYNSTREKCPHTGLCVPNLSKCAEIEKNSSTASGCPAEKPYKCPLTHKCVANQTLECDVMDSACAAGQIMCSDGFCSSIGFHECNSDEHFKDCEVEGRTVSCINDPDKCAKSLKECYNSINCKVGEPYRCPNGECSRYPAKFSSSIGCDVGISCPNYKPVLCADGTCVENEFFCKSFTGCKEGEVLCTDKTCAASQEECKSSNHQKCPSKTPVLCSNGNCGSGIFDCHDGKCPAWFPYYCVLGNCTDTPRVCQEMELDPVTFQKKMASVCDEGEYICLDGSCRENPEECPIYPGCVTSEKSFKCLDGACAANKDSCSNENNQTFFNCSEGKSLCEDGLCRDNCSLVDYYGCPNEKPLLCPNGRCVTSKIECVGESSCDSTEKPFRCIDGTCGASLSDCKTAFREVGDTNVLISVFPKMELSADLIIGPNSILSGRVEIPAETITLKNDNSSAQTQIGFKTIARSHLNDTYSEYDKTRMDDLKAIYPYADPDNNYTLTYQYTVLSSAVKVNLKEPGTTVISGRVLLTLLFDFPHLHEKLEKSNIYDDEEEDYQKTQRYTTLPLNYFKDVCLGKLDTETRKWDCTGLNFNVQGKSDLQLTGELNEDGIYAVILHLRMNDNLLYIEENWFLAHLKLLTIIFIIILLLIGIAIYVFGRIYRYRQKYKGTKEVYKGFEVEINDLQDKSVTGRQGQTYGDVKEGIIYTDNIAFKSQLDGDARKKNSQLEKIFDAYTKKLRLLERNNALLKGQYDSIKNEYNRLNNYKDTLKEGDQVKVEVNIKDPSENPEISGGINDDDDD